MFFNLVILEHANEIFVQCGVGLGNLLGSPALEAFAALEAQLALFLQLGQQKAWLRVSSKN